jgi:hypothetical protein
MRLRSLIAAAAACTPLLVPTAAFARKHPNPAGCQVNINVAPRLIEAGETALIFGRLGCRGKGHAAVAGKTVRLMQAQTGSGEFHVVGSTSTDSRGFYELARSGIEYNSTFLVGSRGARSGRRVVHVLAHVALSAPPDGSQLFTGAANQVSFSGTVSPQDVGARVVLQRQNATTGDEWHRIGLGRVGLAGTYSITHTFVIPGDANIRVLVRSQGRNAPSPSEVMSYEISQAQNPQLTINASADPLIFGQAVTIGGTASGAPKLPLTLFARTADRPSFAAVAVTMPDASGDYAFPAQAPVASTFYQVSTAAVCVRAPCPGTSSAVLYEGVRDLLTAQVSATTIEAGNTLTFSGAVAPDHAGHVIYLERQDRFGGEFHVVEVSVVGPGSTYSIAHTVYDRGVKVFKVKIPGGPENIGAQSAPFTIVVKKAPPERLKPEAPTNSTQPSEGED